MNKREGKNIKRQQISTQFQFTSFNFCSLNFFIINIFGEINEYFLAML
jgi:hypothetical protein